MICPHCGELTPPGPLDVRNCAPRSSARNNTSLGAISRLLRSLLAWRQRMRNLLPTTAKSSLPCAGTFPVRIGEFPDDGARPRPREK